MAAIQMSFSSTSIFASFSSSLDFLLRLVLKSCWGSCAAQKEFHTRRGWRPKGVKKQIDYIVGPRDLKCQTRYFNKDRLSAWDDYPVVV